MDATHHNDAGTPREPTIRGPWGGRRRGFVSLLVCAMTFVPATMAGPDPDGSELLDSIFRAYDLVTLDAKAVRDDLDQGSLTLSLGATSFELSVEPVDSLGAMTCLDCGADGTPVSVPLDPIRASFHGTVVGSDDSMAFVGVSRSGVMGAIRDHATTLLFEPATRFDAALPNDVVVVYAPADITGHGARSHHAEPTPTPLTSVVAALVPPLDPLSIEALSFPDLLIMWDSTMYNGDYGPILNAIDYMDTNYNAFYDIDFYWEVKVCSTAACDATWGMTSSDSGTLLTQWSAIVYDYYIGPGKWDAGHVMSAKGSYLSCGDGVGWQPGRYSAQMYSYAYCTWETASLTAGHEVGHNFNGDHSGAPNPNCPSSGQSSPTGVWGRSRCWGRWFQNMVYVCPSPWNIIYDETGFCASGGHNEDQGGYQPVRSMMWGNGISNWVFEESTGGGSNQQSITTCGRYSHGSGSYVPGDTSGFGSWCTM